MQQRDWAAWRDQDETREFVHYLQDQIEAAKATWAARRYVPGNADVSAHALSNATALGAVDNMIQIVALFDADEGLPEFVEPEKPQPQEEANDDHPATT